MTARIIGITGKAGAGKDTVADYLVANYGFTKISFAAILKNMMRVAGMPEPANREDKEKKVDGFNFSWREAAQKLGTEWGRSLDSDIWVKLTMLGLDPEKKYVISDVRFDNEADAVRNSGGAMLALHGRQANLGEHAAHASEAGILFYPMKDLIVNNAGDYPQLYANIDNLMKDAK